jgi:RNA polymerase sigma factor (sigma-70 family)
MKTEDGSIISKCINGEPEAFGILVDKYKAGIYAYVYTKIQDFHDAQDVTQEVFLQAYRDLHSLIRWESFAFWLYRIAYTKSLQWVQMQSKRLDSEFIDDQDSQVLEEYSIDTYKANQMDESLQETLDSLPEIYREVLTLYYFSDMDSTEIARVLGCSPDNVRQRLSRARTQLKEEIIAMMSDIFKEHKLQASFTFRIVEAVKRTKINPISTIKGLPWGLSLVMGIIITIYGLNPNLISFDNISSIGAPLLKEANVLKVGEIPIDLAKVSEEIFISDQLGGNSKGAKNWQNSILMAPQLEGGKWVSKSDMKVARCQLASVAVDGKIYAIGGLSTEFVALSTVEIYDPINDKWSSKSPMPTARIINSSVSVVDGIIYAIGGGNMIPTVEAYDPKIDKWVKKADMNVGRNNLCTCVVNGRIYAIGGLGGNPAALTPLSALEEYDPVKDMWTKKSDMPTPRDSLCAAAVKGKIYVIGGESVFGADWGPGLSILEEYDPTTDKWTRKADMLTPRLGVTAVVLNDKIYVIGGRDTKPFYPIVEIYDPATDKWTSAPNMQSPRAFPGCCELNGKIYAIGGWNVDSALSSVEEYDPEGKVSQVIPSRSKMPTKWGKVK